MIEKNATKHGGTTKTSKEAKSKRSNVEVLRSLNERKTKKNYKQQTIEELDFLVLRQRDCDHFKICQF